MKQATDYHSIVTCVCVRNDGILNILEPQAAQLRTLRSITYVTYICTYQIWFYDSKLDFMIVLKGDDNKHAEFLSNKT